MSEQKLPQDENNDADKKDDEQPEANVATRKLMQYQGMTVTEAEYKEIMRKKRDGEWPDDSR